MYVCGRESHFETFNKHKHKPLHQQRANQYYVSKLPNSMLCVRCSIHILKCSILKKRSIVPFVLSLFLLKKRTKHWFEREKKHNLNGKEYELSNLKSRQSKQTNMYHEKVIRNPLFICDLTIKTKKSSSNWEYWQKRTAHKI